MNMEEWLHCNLCLIRLVEKKLSFFLTNCGHIFCGQCTKKGKIYESTEKSGFISFRKSILFLQQ